MPSLPLTRLSRAIEEFRKLDPDMPLHTAAVLLMIAADPKVTQTDLISRAGVSKSAMSRIFDTLSDRPPRLGKPGGLRLIKIEDDVNDRRFRVTTILSRGRMVLAALENLMEN